MSRGFVYTDTDILKLFEQHGSLTIDDIINLTDMARSTAYQRVERLRKRGALTVVKSLPSDTGGRPAKVYASLGKHRPSIIQGETGHIIFAAPMPLDHFKEILTLFDGISLGEFPLNLRKSLFRAVAFPTFARAALLLRSREHRTQYLVKRDELVKEGEELVAFLKGLIDGIESTIYSPEFRDPYESNFTNIAEDYHQYAYDHYENYKPIMLSEAHREDYDNGHILPNDGD